MAACCLVAKSCQLFGDPHGMSQARILEWVFISFYRALS